MWTASYEHMNFQGMWGGGGGVGAKISSALPSLNSFSKVCQNKIEPLLPSYIPISLPAKSSCNVSAYQNKYW